KAWAILMRAALLPGVRPGAAALTAAYETLTTMAAGALIAAGVIPWLLAGQESLGAQALGLLALAGLPILPGVFNAIIARVPRRAGGAGGDLPAIAGGRVASDSPGGRGCGRAGGAGRRRPAAGVDGGRPARGGRGIRATRAVRRAAMLSVVIPLLNENPSLAE